MSLTKEEMLKLAEKYSAHVIMPDSKWAKTEPAITFGELSDFVAYTSAIESPLQAENEKLRVEVAMLVGAINAYEAAKAYARQYGHLTEASEQIASAFEDAEGKMQAAISTTQATAEAFRAEVEARALEEAASVAYAWPDDQHAELELRCMAAEKRKQAEQGKEPT